MSREIIEISEKSDFSLLRIFSPAATSYALLGNYRRTWDENGQGSSRKIILR